MPHMGPRFPAGMTRFFGTYVVIPAGTQGCLGKFGFSATNIDAKLKNA
jgi:hypothetical protein